MKKLTAVILGLSVVLSLTACGGQRSTATQDDGAASTGDIQSTDKGGIISTTEEIIQPEKELSTFEKLFADGPILAQGQNELWGYIDSTGAWIFDPQLNESDNDFIEGLALVQDPNSELWGFINEKGEWAVEPVYEKLYEFSEGLAKAQDAETKRWGFIDKNGEWAITPKYESVSAFHDGLAAVSPSKDDLGENEPIRVGYINKNGKLIIPYQYGVASLFNDERAFVVFDDGASGYSPFSYAYSDFSRYGDLTFRDESKSSLCLIDNSGNNLGMTPYGFLPFKADVASKQGEYVEWSYDWLILADKELATTIRHDGMRGGDWSNGYAWGATEQFNSLVVDKSMNICFNGYDHNCNILRILNSRGDLYVIDKATGKYGIASIDGEWIVEPDCNSLLVFADKIYLSRDDDLLPSGGYTSHVEEIDGIGGENPPAKEFTTENERAMILYEKIEQVDGTEKHGFVDQDGNTVIDCIYDAVGRIGPNDGTCFGAQIDGLWGIAGRDGSWLIQPMFLDIKGIDTLGYAFPRAQ